MGELRIIGSCENCIHNKVCKYILEREDAIEKINCRIDNVLGSENLFSFNTECKYWDEKAVYHYHA